MKHQLALLTSLLLLPTTSFATTFDDACSQVDAEIGRELVGPSGLSPVELVGVLKYLSTDLGFDDLGSESNSTIEVVRLAAVEGGGTHSQEAVLASLAPLAAELASQVEDPQRITYFFDPDEEREYAPKSVFGEFLAFNIDKFAAADAFVDFLRSDLVDLKAFVLGKDGGYVDGQITAEYPAFVLGTAVDGSVIGFRATVIWT